MRLLKQITDIRYAHLDHMRRLHAGLHPDLERGQGDSFLSRIVEISGTDHETQITILSPNKGRLPNGQQFAYVVSLRLSAAETVKQLNAAGVPMEPVRPTQNGYSGSKCLTYIAG